MVLNTKELADKIATIIMGIMIVGAILLGLFTGK